MAKVAVLVAVLSLFVLGAGVAGAATPPAPGCAVSASASSGAVDTVVASLVWVTFRYVGSGVGLRRGDSICTNASGQADWSLTKGKTVICTSYPGARLRIYPPSLPKEVVHFSAGTSSCATKGSSVYLDYGAGAKVRIRVVDPVFSVTVAEQEGTTVKLVRGFAEVSGESGPGGRVLVGPAQQTIVPVQGDPQAPTLTSLTKQEQAALPRLLRTQPQPFLARPTAKGSRVLSDVFRRGSIRVGLDADMLSAETRGFVGAYFDFLARRWKIKVESSELSTDEGVKAVAGGGLDVFVTPADLRERAPELLTSPFVPSTDGSVVWQLALPEDDAYVEAVVSFLQNLLYFGKYGNLYRNTFGGEPPFAAIEGVLPLAPPQNPAG